MQLRGGRQHTINIMLAFLGLATMVGAFVLDWYEKQPTAMTDVALPVFTALGAAAGGAAWRNAANARGKE